MENDEIEELQSDWVEIQSVSYYPNESQWYRNDNTVVMKDGVFTTDWTIAVSPPSNQEDLPTGSPHQKELVEGHESQQLCISSSSGDHNGDYGEGNVEKKAGRWTRMESMSSAIGKIVSGIKSGAVSRASIRLFISAATGGVVGAVALVLVLCMRAKKWQRRQVQAESKNHLMLLIKAKDQKISELLLQISELNGMLLARRRVPVVQVG